MEGLQHIMTFFTLRILNKQFFLTTDIGVVKQITVMNEEIKTLFLMEQPG
jgi:hypothetical protein